jgi:hypothetical protein
MQESTAFLRYAIREGTIESFEYVVSSLVSVSLHSPPAREAQMCDFPLASGDAWYPALDDPNKVYLSIDMMPMMDEQIKWLNEHQAKWKYEDW